jgi:hypothetical protein
MQSFIFRADMPVQKLLLIFSILVCMHLSVSAQKKNAAFEAHIHKATSPVIIDGVVDEDAWQQAEAARNFFYGIADGYKLCKCENRGACHL